MRRMTQTPVRRVAGHDRPLDRRRAAPARQQRGMDVEHRKSLSSGSRISWPKAQTTTACGPAARIRSSAAASLTFSVCSSSSPSSCRGERGRRRLSPAAAAPAAVGRGDDQRRAVGGVGQPPQDGGGEVGGAEVGGSHASVRGSRNSPSVVELVLVGAGCSCRPRAAPAARPCAGRGWCGRGSGRRRGGRSRAGGRAPPGRRPRSGSPPPRRRGR